MKHDVNISGDEIVTKGILTRSEWEWCHDKSLELFQWDPLSPGRRD